VTPPSSSDGGVNDDRNKTDVGVAIEAARYRSGPLSLCGETSRRRSLGADATVGRACAVQLHCVHRHHGADAFGTFTLASCGGGDGPDNDPDSDGQRV